VTSAESAHAALRDVLDPEYPVGLVDLGLIRGVRVEGSTAHVQLVFCNLGCPCTELICDDVESRLLELEGIEAVEIEEVFDRWTRADVSAEGLRRLREVGVA
jgi:metal-sulfur cluster biosynthetic enzyme